ncbi:cytochrome b2, mitochondrial precursor [Suhomyces tanzawaensis NRRL Y-17324]|uniref:L-lactate dehydrogenase (cytochrome) n=1 Tax=Suhomyces tanzawaensis NRRL Y-17324 TaxID=984487 RepID=A0A1E4SFD9_9ASCO|nr:cytochrome b2, mitochondrial precursor [Suhomyces tanzawaensis NRRL Y-17324]ODV78186.1 cytochrome b2, mitochondrial precursor [Suhomyces tanzawaensis NRRL Y-17324]
MAALAAATALTADSIALDTNKHGVSVAELQKHTSLENGVWVAINGEVYDLTEFLLRHPGGAKIILKYAGKNASTIFNKFHPKDVFEQFLTPEQHLGPLLGELQPAQDITEGEEDEARLVRIEKKPALAKIFNASDFEHICKQIIPPNAWAYYSSAADDEISLRENHYAYQRVFFNPRVLRNVTEIDLTTTMLGVRVDAPFYCSAAALAKLGQPEGELSIARGCGSENIIQMISNNASYTFDEIVDAAKPDQPQWFQLYVSENRDLNYKAIEKCNKRGIKGIFVTVDAALFGKREKDMRFHLLEDDDDDGDAGDNLSESGKILSAKDPGLTWEDIKKFKKATDLPIVLKGIQTVDDVLMAIDHEVKGVVLSNHGGRQLDFSRAPLEVLADVSKVLKEKKLEDKLEIYLDGGVRRGTDILKALCLGAKGVGLGRPFLYANSAYGQEGVEKLIQLLKLELSVDMKLLGVSKIDELGPEYLDIRNLHARHLVADLMYNSAYDPLRPPEFRK